MEVQGYIEALTSRPACVQWKADPGVKKKAIENALSETFHRLSAVFDWPFVLGEHYFTPTANEDTYILRGKDNDCRDVISVRNGTYLLKKTTIAAYDEFISSASYTDESNQIVSTIPTTPAMWVLVGNVGGFPQIKICGPPATTSDVWYRYRRKNLTAKEWPDTWAYVLIVNVEASLFGSGAPYNADLQFRPTDPAWFDRRAERALYEMIDNFERGGGEDDSLPLSRKWKAKFRRRNRLHGFS